MLFFAKSSAICKAFSLLTKKVWRNKMATGIEYLNETWNPIQTTIKGELGQGYHCTKISKGCQHCWAEGMNLRIGNKIPYTQNDKIIFEIKESELLKPLKWKKPRVIGVQFMSDLFHPSVPFEFIFEIYHAMMCKAPQHTYTVLTKRPERAKEFFDWWLNSFPPNKPRGVIPFSEYKNIWLGVSVEDQQTADERIPLLLQIPAAIRFISAEPLIDKISFRWAKWLPISRTKTTDHLDGLRMLDWIIAGGESGRNARPCHPDWIRSLRDQCKEADVPFFFKQWGEYIHADQAFTKLVGYSGSGFVKVGKKRAGRLLDGIEHSEFPEQC